MKQVNLFRLYKMGSMLAPIAQLKAGDKRGDVFRALREAEIILFALKYEATAAHLGRTADAAGELHTALSQFVQETDEGNFHTILDDEYVRSFQWKVERFEAAFRFEAERSSVFSVNPKGIYDTRLLIESPENRFPEKTRNLLPPQTLYDFREAGKCLAFECPTAAAFHTLRGTEALMIKYYEVLAGTPWNLKQRDWGAYIRELKAIPADTRITDRLDEIRRFERNPILHPENNVELERALPLFEMVGGVIVLMVEEIEKLEAAKAAASSPSSPPASP
jgi:hypothetical protein